MPENKSILLFQRILPSYRIPVFRRLYREFGMIACYSLPVSSISPENAGSGIDFPAIRVKRLKVGRSSTAIIQNPLPVLSRMRPALIISEGAPSYLTLWLLLLLRPSYGYKLCLWSHGVKFHEMDKPFQGLRGCLQKWLFNRADAVLLYSKQRAEIVKKTLRNPAKVFVARNTLDTAELGRIYEVISQAGKEAIRDELNMRKRFNLIFIGRLLENKGLVDLMEAFRLLHNDGNIGLNIVGDGPEKEKLLSSYGSDQRIKFYGPITDPFMAGKLLYASDLMVMPGYVGLAVVHAFSFGCPVITYKSINEAGPAHSPEVEYIHDGINGLFCDPYPGALASALQDLFQEPEKISAMSHHALETVKNEASIEKMMDGFRDMISFLNKS